MLVFQGEVPKTAMVVKEGVVKTYNLTAEGEEKPISFSNSGDVVPQNWAFDIAPSAMYFYEAFTPVEVFSLAREEYLKFLSDNPGVLYQELLRSVIYNVSKTMRLNALQYSKARDKIIYTLHYLAITYGKPLKPGVVEIQLPLNHQDFANLTGLTRETTAVELHKLKKQGVISYQKHMLYQVWMDKLNKLLSDQFLAELRLKLS